MPLETATYISDLDSANPAASDQVKQGDDHIRLIKAALLATFPNIAGAVTLDQDEINALANAGVPTGSILIWYGAAVDCPSGYGICDGSTYPKSDGSGNITSPDLRDKVVIGCGTLQATPGGSYGAATAGATSGSAGDHVHTISGDGTHTHPGLSVASHVLTTSEIPAHSHDLKVYDRADTDTLGSGGSGDNTVSLASGNTAGYIGSTGGGAGHSHGTSHPTPDGIHTHTMDTVGAHTHSVTVSTYQPSMALHHIMKL